MAGRVDCRTEAEEDGSRMMERVIGVNLGNWLVLEKWMDPGMFEGSGADDETWLNRNMDPEELEERMRLHRETYITREDFSEIASHGINLVRIPVPYFIFGDRPPFSGCITYLDRAFDWAEEVNLKILIDLHTVPGGQNGYDNGGICGVCKWHKDPVEVEYALSVLERLASRYADRPGLWGIEVLNEPISFSVWITSPTFRSAVDKQEAKGSSFIPMRFLKSFYLDAYHRLRKILPEDKVIVFHDGFRLTGWNRFFGCHNLKNVRLDTHIYIYAMEHFVPVPAFWVYRLYIGINKLLIRHVSKHVSVIVGEWCICNNRANRAESAELAQKYYLEAAQLQLDAWSEASGHIYWSYQLLRKNDHLMEPFWKNSWALRRCWEYGWYPSQEEQP